MALLTTRKEEIMKLLFENITIEELASFLHQYDLNESANGTGKSFQVNISRFHRNDQAEGISDFVVQIF